MKKLVAKFGLMFGLLLVLTVVSVNAQSATRYRVNIPFDFNIGEKTFQSGDYFLNSEANFLTFEDGLGNNLFSKIVSPNESADASKMMFNRYENQYFLAKIVLKNSGAANVSSKIERQLAKSQKSEAQKVSVNLTK